MAQKEVYENFKALKTTIEAASILTERLMKKMKKNIWDGVPEDVDSLVDKAGVMKGFVEAIKDVKGS